MTDEVVKDYEDAQTGVTVLETLCMNCGDNGETKLLLTCIPQFRDIILMSFECPHCGWKNNEVQSGSALQDKGHCIELEVKNWSDLDRQVVKSEFATFTIVDLEFDIPPNTQKGVVSTVEGIISKAADGLNLNQSERLTSDPKLGLKIQEVILSLNSYCNGNSFPFKVRLDDPSGNSFIQSLFAPAKDPQIKIRLYERTNEQLHNMGYYGSLNTDKEDQDIKSNDNNFITTNQPKIIGNPDLYKKGADLPDHLVPHFLDLNKSIEDQNNIADDGERIKFNVFCPHCGRDGESNVCEVDIPGFRRCLIMAFVCDYCGAKTNELKPAGPYGEFAKKWTLKIQDPLDLNRDVLKSDTAALKIPELEFEMSLGSLGSVFTTVEGLIMKITDSLKNCYPFQGDSAEKKQKAAFKELIKQLEDLVQNQTPFTLILDDAADHSFIGKRIINGAICDTDEQLNFEIYTRTPEQDEELGISYMKVENYEE
ncbi:putative zinc-finger protein ZPR1 [Cryptosporidium serpentis]